MNEALLIPSYTDLVTNYYQILTCANYLCTMTHLAFVLKPITSYCFNICDRLQENRAQRGPTKKFFWHLHTPWHADIKLSKFYRRSFSHSRYISPNRSLRQAYLIQFYELAKSIFLRCLRMPRCARFSHRRSHIYRVTTTKVMYSGNFFSFYTLNTCYQECINTVSNIMCSSSDIENIQE